MNFVRSLIGGIVIMILATLVGVAQNAVRSDAIALFPKVTKPSLRGTSPPAKATNDATTGQPGAENPAPATASRVTDEELTSGELSRDRVRAFMEAGTATIIDARDSVEFGDGHIPGALNIPYQKFVEYYNDLVDFVPADAVVIVYCRSVTCDLSDNLAQELRLMGYETVLVYRGGWQEWTEAAFPAETE